MPRFVLILNILLLLTKVCVSTVETVKGSELDNIIATADKMLILSAPEPCGNCHDYNEILLELDSYLSPSIRFLKVEPKEISWCENCPSPAFLIVQKGRKILYQDLITSEDLQSALNLVENCQIRHLTDHSFEHDTQAATGGTTGDWLVLFTEDDNVLSKLMYEGLALRLRQSNVNVAIVTRESGYLTFKRFQIQKTPVIYFFRQGSMYKYPFDMNSPASLYQFAVKSFKQLNKEKVPMALTWFDEFTDKIVLKLKDYEKIWGSPVFRAVALAFGIALVFFLFLLAACSAGGSSDKKKKNE